MKERAQGVPLAGLPDGSAAPGTGAGPPPPTSPELTSFCPNVELTTPTPELSLAAEPCSGSEPDAASIEWLPGEVLALVFGFVGAKTLTATIPAVSQSVRMWVGWGEWGE